MIFSSKIVLSASTALYLLSSPVVAMDDQDKGASTHRTPTATSSGDINDGSAVPAILAATPAAAAKGEADKPAAASAAAAQNDSPAHSAPAAAGVAVASRLPDNGSLAATQNGVRAGRNGVTPDEEYLNFGRTNFPFTCCLINPMSGNILSGTLVDTQIIITAAHGFDDLLETLDLGTHKDMFVSLAVSGWFAAFNETVRRYSPGTEVRTATFLTDYVRSLHNVRGSSPATTPKKQHAPHFDVAFLGVGPVFDVNPAPLFRGLVWRNGWLMRAGFAGYGFQGDGDYYRRRGMFQHIHHIDTENFNPTSKFVAVLPHPTKVMRNFRISSIVREANEAFYQIPDIEKQAEVIKEAIPGILLSSKNDSSIYDLIAAYSIKPHLPMGIGLPGDSGGGLLLNCDGPKVIGVVTGSALLTHKPWENDSVEFESVDKMPISALYNRAGTAFCSLVTTTGGFIAQKIWVAPMLKKAIDYQAAHDSTAKMGTFPSATTATGVSAGNAASVVNPQVAAAGAGDSAAGAKGDASPQAAVTSATGAKASAVASTREWPDRR